MKTNANTITTRFLSPIVARIGHLQSVTKKEDKVSIEAVCKDHVVSLSPENESHSHGTGYVSLYLTVTHMQTRLQYLR